MAVSATYTGWHFDRANSRLDFYYRGTRVGHISSSGLNVATGGLTVVTGGATITAGDLTLTAGALKSGGATTWLTQAVGPMAQRKTVTTATNTATLTVAQFRSQHIDGTPTSAATYTTPTAAQLVADVDNAEVGTSYYISINNKAGGAYTITLSGGTGVTVDGTATVAQNVCRLFLVTFTNVTSSSEAVSIYGLGA